MFLYERCKFKCFQVYMDEVISNVGHSTPWSTSLNLAITIILWLELQWANISLLLCPYHWMKHHGPRWSSQTTSSYHCCHFVTSFNVSYHYYVPLLEWNTMLVMDHHVMLGHCYKTCNIFIVSLQPFSRYMYQLKVKEVAKRLQGRWKSSNH